MLQSLGQLRVGRFELSGSLLEFLEQPDVLDGDDGLVGKDLQQSDLLVGERTDLCTPNRNHSNRSPLPQQRCAKDSSSSSALLEDFRFRKLAIKFSGDVMDMDCRPVDHRPS